MRAGASVYPGKGVCGDPATQTCSKQTRLTSTQKLLFAGYAGEHKDDSSNVHALCTGENQCCNGGLWGDVVPKGKCRKAGRGVPLACLQALAVNAVRQGNYTLNVVTPPFLGKAPV